MAGVTVMLENVKEMMAGTVRNSICFALWLEVQPKHFSMLCISWASWGKYYKVNVNGLSLS
jgi:hypothetical protein